MQSEGDESWIEKQSVEAISSQPNYEYEFVTQRDASISNVFDEFQESATSIAQLYGDRTCSGATGALWRPFQAAAGTVTTLYKKSCEGIKRTSDVAIQCGYQRRTREIADWARSKKRRYIRREELLAYLAGKPLSPLHMTRMSQLRLTSKPEPQYNKKFLVESNQMPNESTTDLHTFNEALAGKPGGNELYAFVASEIARHCKRPASPSDVNMDVENICNKRQRFM